MNARLLALPLALCLSAAASVSRADTSSGVVKFVEYIESSGTQFIDTGWTPTNRNVRIEATYQYVALPETGKRTYVFGSCLWTVANTRLQYAVGSPGKCAIGFGSQFKETTFDSYETNLIHKVVCSNGVFSLDGTTSGEWDLSSGMIDKTSKSHAVFLFAFNSTQTGDVCPGDHSSIRLYSCRIWENGCLVRDFRPVLKDGTACLYDAVCGTFHFNGGSGAFAAGGELPTTYRKALWIESDRTAYVDTEYKPGAGTEFEMKFAFTRTLSSRTYVFGEYGASAQGRFMFAYGPASTGCFLGYGANYDGAVAGVPYNEDIHVARYVPGEGFSFDGAAVVASKSMTTWSGTAANLYLGANNPNGGGIDSNQLSPIRIYYCKIWENGVLVRNLVPKQRANDGRNGLYDEVNGGFYGFIGTGTTALVPPMATVIVVK